MGGWVLILGSWGGGNDATVVPTVPGCEYKVENHRPQYEAEGRAQYRADSGRPHYKASGRPQYRDDGGDRPHYVTEEE